MGKLGERQKLSISRSVTSITSIGGTVSIRETQMHTGPDFSNLLESDPDITSEMVKLIILDLESIAEYIERIRKLPDSIKPKGWPKKHRPVIEFDLERWKNNGNTWARLHYV